MHVALDFHGEKLRGHHQTSLAIPFPDAHLARIGVECTAIVFVEAHHNTDVVFPGLDGVVGGNQGAAASGTAVGDIDKRHPG